MVNYSKIHFYVILLYCLIGIIGIYFLLPLIVKLVFEIHYPYVDLVLISIPGLVFRILADPVSVFLNSTVNLKPIFWCDLLSLVFYISAGLYVISIYEFNLIHAVYLFNFYFFIKFLMLFATYYFSPIRRNFL